MLYTLLLKPEHRSAYTILLVGSITGNIVISTQVDSVKSFTVYFEYYY